MWNFHAVFTLVSIQQQVEAAGAHSRHLTHNDVLRDTSHGINFGMTCSVHQHIDCFFEGTSHKCSSVLSVDSVTSDGHQVTLCCHDVTQQSKMPIVDVQSIELQDSVHFLLDGLTNSFNSQHAEDLADIVTECSNWIDISFTENLHHRCSVSLEQPFSDSLEFTGLSDDNSFLGVGLRKL